MGKKIYGLKEYQSERFPDILFEMMEGGNYSIKDMISLFSRFGRHISAQTITNWLNSKSVPKEENAEVLEQILEIPHTTFQKIMNNEKQLRSIRKQERKELK